MQEELQIVLKEYIKEVESICDILVKGINDLENLNLKTKYDFFEYRLKCKKLEFKVGDVCYRFHGKGCVAFNEKMFIDWDFGYRGRWCGINPWKFSMTLKKNNSPYVVFYDWKLIQEICEKLIEKGLMFKQHDQYYFQIAADETFKPEFPKEYDKMIVEYFDFIWSIPRNKSIDRFIRKSTRIHNQIYERRDNYILKFKLEGKEIYKIPYNDVSYPENAVRIMSDEIIKHLRKEKNF